MQARSIPAEFRKSSKGHWAEDCIAAALRRHGTKLSRDSYIGLAYGSTIPSWGWELELELPEEIQDLSGTQWPWGNDASDDEEEDDDD
jgi:hypothetical protein